MYIAPTTTIIRWLEPYNYTNCNSPSLRPYRRPTLLLKYHAIPSSDSSFYSNTQRLSGQQLSATFLALDCRKFISFNPVTRVHTFTYVQSPLRRWQCTASNLSVIALDRRERHAETFNKVNLASRASVMASRLAIGRLDSWLAGWLVGLPVRCSPWLLLVSTLLPSTTLYSAALFLVFFPPLSSVFVWPVWPSHWQHCALPVAAA